MSRAARKARRAARHAAAGRIRAPEGVELNLPVAGIGARLGAQLTDILLTLAFVVAAMVLLIFGPSLAPQTLIAVGALLFFITRVPYYVLTELAWNGQTLGKRLMKIKVVSHFGGPLTTHAVVLRNVVKEAEVFLPVTLILTLDRDAPVASGLALGWVVLTVAVPLSNPHRMRLGDMLAGTHVVQLPVPVLLPDVARAPRAAPREAPGGFAFQAHQLDHYGRFELQTLESVLRVQSEASATPERHARNRATLASIVERVRKKVGYADAVAPADHLAFLQAFYNAQRAYLEQRQLFGDRRADKRHRDAPAERR